MYKNPEKDFYRADSTNLPKSNMFMVRDFLVSDSRFNAPEVRGVKIAQYVGKFVKKKKMNFILDLFN